MKLSVHEVAFGIVTLHVQCTFIATASHNHGRFVRVKTADLKHDFQKTVLGRAYATVLRPSIVCDVMYCG